MDPDHWLEKPIDQSEAWCFANSENFIKMQTSDWSMLGSDQRCGASHRLSIYT